MADPSSQLSGLQWHVSPGLTGYRDAIAAMEAHVEALANGGAAERVWLLEHPSVITAGTSADAKDLIAPDRFPVERADRKSTRLNSSHRNTSRMPSSA